jgi:hypothetical protein
VTEWILIGDAFKRTRVKFGWSRETAQREMDEACYTGQLGEMRADHHKYPDGTIEYHNIKIRIDALLRYWQSIEARK